jgi:protocatechuate 3,4-dioxygenase, alpha subunit
MSDAPLVATASQTVGPFFHFCLTHDTTGRVLQPLAPRERIHLLVTVIDGDGRAVPDAVVELWHVAGGAASAFGRMGTDRDGTCEFETIHPDCSADATGARHAAHINVCLFARGLLRQLHTRIYFAGDPALDADAALMLVPEERRATLLATPDETQPSRWRFDVRLQGSNETVFFDA